MTEATGQTMEGIDVPKVSQWLTDNVEGVQAPFDFELIAGGRSNLTFGVTDASGRRLVLRRPPTSHVLSTAHDMGREHKIISALQGSPVPVPTTLGLCVDESVNGKPFYVMDFVEGHILRSAAEGASAIDEATRRIAGDDLIDVLVALHSLDVDAVGLGDLGRREGYIERQLKRWYGQFKQSQTQEQEAGIFRPAPVVDEVHEMLASAIPEQQGVAIAHGDYRLDNTVIGPDGKVRAVLDWELCTLGDPLADLGTMLVYWADPDAPDDGRVLPTTALPGFPDRFELAERYAAESGRDVSKLPYYVAFGNWKLACIMEGVYSRFASGAMGGQSTVGEGYAAQVLSRAGQARDILTKM